MTQPSPYSQAVEPIIAARDAKIRELEAELLALKETVRSYLAVDGSQGNYEAVTLWEVRKKLGAMVEPKACLRCGHMPNLKPLRNRLAVDATVCPDCGIGCVDGVCRCDGEAP